MIGRPSHVNVSRSIFKFQPVFTQIRKQLESLFAVEVQTLAVSDERVFRCVDSDAHEPMPPRQEFNAGEDARLPQQSFQPALDRSWGMPTKYALDFRHVRDSAAGSSSAAPFLGAETDEPPRVEIIRYPFDDLAHGSALACSNIVRPVRVRRRQQAHEQVSDIRRVDEIPRSGCRRSR